MAEEIRTPRRERAHISLLQMAIDKSLMRGPLEDPENAVYPSAGPQIAEEHFCLENSQIRGHVEKLFDLGLIDRQSDRQLISKDWVVVPYDREFESLKDVTFARAYEQFHWQDAGLKIRNVVTFLATPDQQEEIKSKIRSLIDWFISIEDKTPQAKSVPYTFGVFGSPRLFGNG